MDTPLVSFIIPAYNAERFIDRCLDSILHQSFKDYEIIVVNDGSTDDTQTILAAYTHKDQHLHIINQRNKGVSVARNIGISEARGKWISFVDIDDFLSEDFVIPNELEMDVDLIVKRWQYIDAKKTIEELKPEFIDHIHLKNYLSQYLHYSVFRTPWAKFFRKDIIVQHKITFNPAYKLGEDNLFVLEYLKYTDSITVSGVGKYMYERPKRDKYPLRFTESYRYMHDFAELYYLLGVNNRVLVRNKLIWMSSFTTDFTISSKIKWNIDKTINKLYRSSMSQFGIRERIKIIAYSIISIILYRL